MVRYLLVLVFLLSLNKVLAQLSCSGKTTVNFNFTGSVQSWTVPAGITTITIKTRGGSGGVAPSSANFAGGGAIIEADYTVVPGQTVTILVGGAGVNGNDFEAGGGGATAVYINGVLKLVAGGGGGEDNTGNGGNGLAGTSGGNTAGDNAGNCCSAAANGQGGTGGNGGNHGESACGGSCVHGGGGGGGLNSAGGSLGVNAGRGGVQGNIAGAAGGLGSTDDASGVNGGWGWAGGGGADDRESGGGGGYSGGGGGPESFNPGGGGSFSDPVNRTAFFSSDGTGTTSAINGIVTICYFTTLPVTLVSFSGRTAETSNKLYWQTAQEVNLEKFIVEKSEDGVLFNPAGEIPAVNRFSGSVYQFTDQQTVSGKKYFYRLRIQDLDQSYRYSSVIVIHNNGQSVSLAVYPNPATDLLMISSSDPVLKYEILNTAGQVLQSGNHLNLGNPLLITSLKKGVYLLKAETPSGIRVKKFSKL